MLEQQGFRKLVDTSFMIGFLINGDATDDQLRAYFNALQRAQREIDVAKERYQRYFLEELPQRYHPFFDHRRAGIGERLVFEPYTPGDVRSHPPLDAGLANLPRKPNWKRNLRASRGRVAGSDALMQSSGGAIAAPPF